MKIKFLVQIILVFITNYSYTQVTENIYMGIEIGSSSIKYEVLQAKLILDVLGEIEKVEFQTLEQNTLKIDLVKNNLEQEILIETANQITKVYKSLSKKYNLPDNRIFLCFSYGVISFINNSKTIKTDALDKFQQLVNTKLEKRNIKIDYLNEGFEPYYTLIGLVNPLEYNKFSLVDIGSSNTKAIKVDYDILLKSVKSKMHVEFPIGTVTLVKKAIELKPNSPSKENTDIVLKSYEKEIDKTATILTNNRWNIIITGGIAWAIRSILNLDLENEDYFEINTLQIQNFIDLINSSEWSKLRRDLVNSSEANIINVLNQFTDDELEAGGKLLYQIMLITEMKEENGVYFFIPKETTTWIRGKTIALILDI